MIIIIVSSISNIIIMFIIIIIIIVSSSSSSSTTTTHTSHALHPSCGAEGQPSPRDQTPSVCARRRRQTHATLVYGVTLTITIIIVQQHKGITTTVTVIII